MQPLRIPPAVGQLSHDSCGCPLAEFAFGFVHNAGCGSSDACDVLQKERSRTARIGDIKDPEEQPATRAIEASAATGDAEVLAREARNDEIHAAA